MSKIKTKVSLYIVGGILCSIFANTSSIINTNSAFAENLDYEVNIQPSLVVTIPTNTVELDINPATSQFSSQALNVIVGTNNPTGYTLSMSSSDTALAREGGSETIQTLDSKSGGYTESDFTVNRWGYKLASTNYFPFATNIEVDSNDSPTNSRTSTVTFGAKANTSQASGTYKLDIDFTAVANYVPPTAVDFCATNGIADANCMQKMVASNCTTTAKTVMDLRDGEQYKVQRLADGKCWLLDNLRFDIVAHKDDISSANTNITNSATLTSLKSGNRSAGNNYATAGVSYWTSSYSYSAPLIAIQGENGEGNEWDSNTTTTSYGSGSGKIGVYYNYCAASAGSYCYGDGTSEGTPSGNATEDICPAGWRMPTGGSSGEYQALYDQYNTTQDATDTASLQYNLSTPLSGLFYNDGSAYEQGSSGYLWSSTRYNDGSMYFLFVDSSYLYPPSNTVRGGGISVRCLFQ